MLVDTAHDSSAVALLRKLDVTLDLLDDLHHVYLLSGNDVADVGIDNCVLLEDFLALEVDGLEPLVLRVLVKGLKAHVFAVVADIAVLADDHPLAGLFLVDVDFVVVEHFLFVFFEFEEEAGVGTRDIEDVVWVWALLAGGDGLAVDEVEVVEEADVLKGLADRALKLRQNALLNGALQFVTQRVGSSVLVLVEEKDEIRRETVVRLEDNAFAVQREQLVQLLNGKLVRHKRAAEFHVVEGDVHQGLLLAHVLGIGTALGEVVCLAVGLPDVVELVFVEGGAHHDAAHLQVLVVLLVEIPLLPPRLLPEQIYVHCPLQPLLRLLHLLPHRIHQLVVTHSFLVHPLRVVSPRTALHLNYSQPQKVTNIMLDPNNDKLWRRIGIDTHQESGPQREGESRSSHQSSGKWQQPYSKEMTPPSASLLQQPPFAPPSVPHRRAEHWHEEAQFLIAQEESRYQQVVQPQREEQGSLSLQNLEEYNHQISGIPESVTPLVYSKASRKEQVRFSKQSAKAIILKLRVAEAKQGVQKVRGEFLQFVEKAREEQEWFQSELMTKYFQMQRQQSMRMQESVFLHQQDCQQLRYQLEVLKNKEELMRCPLDSQILHNSPPAKTDNEELRAQLLKLKEENSRLRKEEQSFKAKMGEIEAKTAEVRHSNDKLYEYIFDLEQKVAYFQEEIPKISLRVKEETQKTFQQQLQQLTAAHYMEMSRSVEQIDALQAENAKLTEEAKRVNELILQLQKEGAETRARLQRAESEVKTMEQQIQAKTKELAAAESESRKIKNQMQKLARQREQVEQWKQETKRQSASRLSRAYSSKEDKRIIEALQVEKLVLQKENIQLKATLEFHHKNQLYSPTIPPKMYPEYQPQTEKDKQLQMKERELLSLQNYLEDEARRLDSKQRDIQSEYILKKTQEARAREHLPLRVNPIDDYGMKRLPVQKLQSRRNHFCSSETQAIIDKVKMRQKMKEACICNQARNCNCEAHSRGSRTSQDSNSRDYLRLHQQRPSNYSPNMNGYEWGRQEKSSKMKLIEEKVRRLKSQLKSSFTALHN